MQMHSVRQLVLFVSDAIGVECNWEHEFTIECFAYNFVLCVARGELAGRQHAVDVGAHAFEVSCHLSMEDFVNRQDFGPAGLPRPVIFIEAR